MKELFVLNKYIFRYKWHFLFGAIFVFLSNYFGTRIPQEIRKALDTVFGKASEIKGGELSKLAMENLADVLIVFILTVFGFAIIKGIFMYFMRQTIVVMSRLIEYDLRKDIFSHYEKLDTGFYKKNKTGDLMSRITEDVNKVRMYLGPALLYGLNLISLFALVIYAMFKVSVTLSLWTLLPIPFVSLSIYLVSNIINKKSQKIQEQLAKLNSISQEVYSGIRVVKSYFREQTFGRYFASESDHFKDTSMELATVNALFYPLMIFLVSASTLLAILIGGQEVIKGNISTGNIAEFVIYVNMLTWPVTAIGWIASIIQQAAASQKRINEFLNTEPTIITPANGKIPLNTQIRFENVSFTYPDSGIEALKNISFTLEPGEKLAILGKTASGKSTIAQLLVRLYDVSSGDIYFGNERIQNLDLKTLRQSIGYVPQDVFLFSDTINNNIAFGVPNEDRKKIQQYAEYASVKEDIELFPKQFETMVGERGVSLSGGQKQRISIARALIKNPELLILDDSLSAVDTTTEQNILNYFKESLNNKSAIIITHRLYNLLNFDKIIVLDEGQIIEQGTHEELMNLNGYYAELQAQQAIEEI